MFACRSEGLEFDFLWWQAIEGLIMVQTVLLFCSQEVVYSYLPIDVLLLL